MYPFILFCSWSCLVSLTPILISKHDHHGEWQAYKATYGVQVTEDEDEKRSLIFWRNLKYISDFNSKSHDLKLGLNKFSHLEKHELPTRLKIRGPVSSGLPVVHHPDLPKPQVVDWRHYGVVSPVLDQGHCGSCYAFSAVAAMTSAFAIRTGKMVPLSEQQIVDCSISEGNQGCGGGWMEKVFLYTMHHGLHTSTDYKYIATEGNCDPPLSNSSETYKLLSYVALKAYDEEQLVRAIAFANPVSIAIDADHPEFRFYQSGVLRIKNCSRIELDHGVVAVGYSLGQMPYLLVKNSWGTDWGINGYVKIALYEDNMCGIATAASYPIPSIPS